MSKEKVWGGHVELYMASEFYEAPLQILIMENKRVVFENSAKYDKAPITVAYHGHGHYEALDEIPGALASHSQNVITNDLSPTGRESLSPKGKMHVDNVNLLSQSLDTSTSTDEDVTSANPPIDITGNCETPLPRLGPKSLSKSDNKNILFCYIWGHIANRRFHGGYSKYALQKWNEIRPDRKMNLSFLATKGKSLHDRAYKDIPVKGNWLSSQELTKIEADARAEFDKRFPAMPSEEGEKEDERRVHQSPRENIEDNDHIESYEFDPHFESQEPDSPEYHSLK